MSVCRDCAEHAPSAPAELIIVEGDAAADSVCAVRDPRLQAVLAMQGKPVNAGRAPRGRVARSPWLAQIAALLGDAPGTALPLGELRYERVVILMDPDADGIHAGALLQIFFHECMPVLLEQRRIVMVHAPWAEIRRPGVAPLLSFHELEFRRQCQQLERDGAVFERIRHRGLGTITPALLQSCCVDPATRRGRALGLEDAALARQVFAGGRR
jgi:DNA gyrase subunit B